MYASHILGREIYAVRVRMRVRYFLPPPAFYRRRNQNVSRARQTRVMRTAHAVASQIVRGPCNSRRGWATDQAVFGMRLACPPTVVDGWFFVCVHSLHSDGIPGNLETGQCCRAWFDNVFNTDMLICENNIYYFRNAHCPNTIMMDFGRKKYV